MNFLSSDPFYIGLCCGLAGIIVGALICYLWMRRKCLVWAQRDRPARLMLEESEQRLSRAVHANTDAAKRSQAYRQLFKTDWPEDPDFRGHPPVTEPRITRE